MDSNLLKTKSIEALVDDIAKGRHLKRTLTALDLTLLGIGSIIGTGIFVLTGTAAANQAGPAITASYMAAGLAGAFAALCYAEFAAGIMAAGAVVVFARTRRTRWVFLATGAVVFFAGRAPAKAGRKPAYSK